MEFLSPFLLNRPGKAVKSHGDLLTFLSKTTLYVFLNLALARNVFYFVACKVKKRSTIRLRVFGFKYPFMLGVFSRDVSLKGRLKPMPR